jgi:DnaJ-like protein
LRKTKAKALKYPMRKEHYGGPENGVEIIMKKFGTSLLLLSFALLPVLRLDARTSGTTPPAESAAENRLFAVTQRDDRDHPDQDHRDFHSDLRITRARYGAGKHIVDVTAELNAQIRQGRLSIPVNNNTMGGDPYRNRAKTLTVWYTVDGRAAQVVLNENDFLELPSGDTRSGDSRDSRDDHGNDSRRQ